MGVQSVFTKLILIVLLGGVLRLWGLTAYPPALNWDEVSHGYSAFALFKTGRDQWSQPLPVLNFRAYGDYPTALNLYFTVPTVAVLGPTDLAARLPHAMMGIITIMAGFIASYWWKRNAHIASFTALLLAFEPWTVFTSRTVLQANVAVMCLTIALALYFRRRLATAIFFGLSLFAYHNARIFVPILVAPLALFAKGKARLRWLAVIGVALAILLLPATRARSKWVGIVDAGAVAYLEQARNTSTLPSLMTKLIYNKPVYWAGRVAKNYLGYFSPQFLFITGGTQYQFSVPKHGVSLPINAPFFYVGLVGIVLSSPILVWWLFLAPVAAAVTQDQFAVVRAMTMIPVVQMVTAYGLWWVWSKLSSRGKKVLKIVYAIAFLASLCLYLNDYFFAYPRQYSQSWQYGYKQLVKYVKADYVKYDKILVTKRYGEPHEFFLWYGKWDPQLYATDPKLKWDYHDNWYWVDGFDKFEFVNDWEMKQRVAELEPGGKYLIVSSPDENPQINPVFQVNFLDGSPAFIVHEI